jgi:hypothetical protein
MDMPPLPDQEIVVTKQSDKIAALEFQNEQLRNRIAALEARLPPEPKPLMIDDLKVYGHQRPTLSLPEVDWMPSDAELKALARIVHKTYPSLVDFNMNWLRDFRIGLLAVNHFCRTAQPIEARLAVGLADGLKTAVILMA